MSSINWNLYEYWLGYQDDTTNNEINDNVAQSILQNLRNNPSYRPDAMRNGQAQPILARRKETRKCDITVIPGDSMYIGDLVTVFNEDWICVELYIDEYGISYGELWMCNQVFCFQNAPNNTIIRKSAVIDDGSYSRGNDKPINSTDGRYTCYMSLDDESKYLHIDKRLAIDTIFNAAGAPILDVGRIAFIDTKSNNYGEDSHLLVFRIESDLYNPSEDNLAELICNYIEVEGVSPEPPIVSGTMLISGRDTIRIGTARTYSVTAIDETGNTIDVNPENISWDLNISPEYAASIGLRLDKTINDYSEIRLEVMREESLEDLFILQSPIILRQDGVQCILTVPLDYSTIGLEVILTCEDTSGLYNNIDKKVVVISIG